MAATTFASTSIVAGDISLPRTGISDGISGVNPNKLWLPLWSGEVIHAYDQYNMFENMITSKSLTGGVTWEFPVTGVVGLNPSWNSGVELGAYSGDANSSSSSFKVSLDKRPMAAHFETDNIDALITQWDFRSELARQSGITLANTRDKQLAVALLAACAVSKIDNDPRPNIANAFQNPAIVAASNTAANCDSADALKCLEEIENYLVACQENDVRRNTQFTVASMMKGTGIIKPEVCKALIGASAGAATRAVLFAHLDGNSVSAAKTQNLDLGFGAEYKQVA